MSQEVHHSETDNLADLKDIREMECGTEVILHVLEGHPYFHNRVYRKELSIQNHNNQTRSLEVVFRFRRFLKENIAKDSTPVNEAYTDISQIALLGLGAKAFIVQSPSTLDLQEMQDNLLKGMEPSDLMRKAITGIIGSIKEDIARANI